MEEKIEIMNLLQNKQLLEHELQSLAYGSVEIRENDSNKYIYVHYREDGVALTKYVGEYSKGYSKGHWQVNRRKQIKTERNLI